MPARSARHTNIDSIGSVGGYGIHPLSACTCQTKLLDDQDNSARSRTVSAFRGFVDMTSNRRQGNKSLTPCHLGTCAGVEETISYQGQNGLIIEARSSRV